MAKNSISSSGGGRVEATAVIAKGSKQKSLADVRAEQAQQKRTLAFDKKRLAAQKKGIAELAKFEAEYAKQLAEEKMQQGIAAAEAEEKAGYAARYKERQQEKANKKAQRAEDIAAAKEMALEQMEGADNFGDKMKAAGAYLKASAMETGDKLKEGLANAVNTAGSALSGALDKYLDTYTEYMSSINARIQGAYDGMDYESLTDVITDNTSGSPYVRYEDALSNLNKLVEAGTAVNLTQRSFLMSISDKIATTFDATDSSLLRLIRLQQNDTTAARLGMEAELTKLFNYYFSDTSYLSQAFDSVASAMTDLSSQLSATGSVEFDYIVQKWLGSLGSVGVEEGTLTEIASAINALGTGQIDQLEGTEMQNLLVMAANRVGLDYGEMLIDGINSTDVNQLLYGVVDYIQETVSGANNVVKAQYAKLFGLSVADINAFENLSDTIVSQLYGSAMSYNDTLTALNEQLGELPNRIHMSEMINNVFDNVLATTGISIANNSGLYGTYKAFDLLESITGGIHIPTITVFGSGITLPDSIEGMVKAGITGIGTAISLIKAVGNWADGAGLNMARWTGNWDKGTYTGFTSMNELQTTKSSTGIVSNTNESGMQQSVYDEQQDSAEEISGTEATGEEDSEMVQLLKQLLAFFTESQSAKHPMFVQLYTPTPTTGEKTLSIVDLLTLIKDRVTTMGTDENPIYAVNDALYGEIGKYSSTVDQLRSAGLLGSTYNI